MERDARKMRGQRPFIFTNMRAGQGINEIARFIKDRGGMLSDGGTSSFKNPR
jgi:urease accessory protein